ncbi:MAG: ribonuclease III [Patescibacteria group bacterium]
MTSARRAGAGPRAAVPVDELAEAIGFPRTALDLLTNALTHRSFANEENCRNNERLEFLGDAVLGLVVGEYFYKRFPGEPEGSLAKMRARSVSAQALAQRGRELGLGRYLRLGRGEAATGGEERDSILADAFEAVIGAFYVLGGLEPAKEFALTQLAGIIEAASRSGVISDYKTELQEILQAKGSKPRYLLTREEGPDHRKVFSVAVYDGERLLGQGRGHSKKAAEQLAASQALAAMRMKPGS